MIRSLAVARIKRGLDFRVGTTLDDTIVAQLQESQRQLEKGRDLPRWLRTEDASFSVASGTADVAFPTRFLREVDGEGFHYVNSTTNRTVWLEKRPLQLLSQRFEGVAAGKPLAYSIRKATFAFFPSRDAAYTLTWSYYAGAVPLDSDIENAWLANNPEALIGHAGMVLAQDLGNDKAVSRFQRMLAESWSGQFAEDIEQERDNDASEMGGRL